jgi:hypothetical protein
LVIFQEVASQGCGIPFLPRKVRLSNWTLPSSCSTSEEIWCGSRQSGSADIAMCSVPPLTGSLATFSSWPGAAVFSAFKATAGPLDAFEVEAPPQAASNVVTSNRQTARPGIARRRRFLPVMTANRCMAASLS